MEKLFEADILRSFLPPPPVICQSLRAGSTWELHFDLANQVQVVPGISFSIFQYFSVFFRYRGLQWLHRCHPCISRLRLLLQKVSNKFQLKLQNAWMALLQARKMIIRSKSKFRILTSIWCPQLSDRKGIFCLSIIKDVGILNSFHSSC